MSILYEKKALAAVMVMLFAGCDGISGDTPGRQSESPAAPSNSTAESSNPCTKSSALSEEEKYNDAPAPVIVANTRQVDYSSEPVPFKTEIDEFCRQVKELHIPDEYQSDYDDYISNGFIYRKLDIDGIQLYEIRPEGDEPKPLVIQIHGGFSHKDPWVVQAWAEKGLCSVNIDVPGHGE